MKQEGLKIPKVEYDVYYRQNGTKLVKLDLSYCSNVKVDLSVPIKITENLDKFNTSSGYYTDICYTATSDTGTDIPLNDRKNEYAKNNQTVCQDDCDFTDYDYDIQKAKCACKVKESSNTLALMKINTDEILNSFKNIKNVINIVILRCYNVLFSKKGVIKNFGFYIIIPILFLHFVFIFIFYTKFLIIINEKITKI